MDMLPNTVEEKAPQHVLNVHRGTLDEKLHIRYHEMH